MPENSSPEPTRYALTSSLLHELRTPLGQIIGYSEMLLEQSGEQEQTELAPDLTKIRAAAGELQKLLETRFHAGTRVEATSPALPPTPTDFSEQNTPHLASGDAHGLILVVDDNEANRDVLTRRLERQGYTVETAASGVAALERARARAFDMVLLDIMMPEMDGYETLRQLKADASTRPIPVIMISAIGEMDSVVRCIEMGAEDYLPKPFNVTLLKARIGASLEKKRGHDREMRLFAQLQDNYARLRQSENMRDDLTHMIVHDLRTPLSSLMAGLQTIPMLDKVSEEQEECLEIALHGGNTLLHMINDLLDISKLESGTFELELQQLDIPSLVYESWTQVASAAKLLQIKGNTQIASALPVVYGDEDKLRRTLVNLLGNAIKFSSYNGKVTVGVRALENEILFCVRDTGEGIPSEAFEQIFEKFGQVESRKAGRQMSTGLGLAFCKMVAETHGGRIWVESELGVGSTFFFTLPLRQSS